MVTEKLINLDDTVFKTCDKYPEVKEIMNELGFSDITKPGMLNTAGRFMTIRKGALLKKISLEQIAGAFEKHGFVIDK